MQHITPTNLTVTADGTYQTVDLTSLVGGDAGSVAVALISTLNTAATDYEGAVRAVGSTDDPYRLHRRNGTHIFWLVKVDASDQVEIKLNASGTWTTKLWGYFTTAEAVGFTNPTAQDYTPGTASAWTDADITADVGGDAGSVAAAIVMVDRSTSGSALSAGLRSNGSTDTDTTNVMSDSTSFHIVPVDPSDIFEAYTSSTGSLKIYLAGYVKANFTGFTNAKVWTGSSTGTYEDIDVSADVPASNTWVSVYVDHGSNSDRLSGLRKNGDTTDQYAKFTRLGGLAVELDGSRIFEHKRSNASIALFGRGYGNAGGVVVPVLAPAHIAGL